MPSIQEFFTQLRVVGTEEVLGQFAVLSDSGIITKSCRILLLRDIKAGVEGHAGSAYVRSFYS